MTKRLVILTFVAYYLPGYKSGGPVRTISNMAARLGDVFDFRVVTLDRDARDTGPYPDVVVNAWNPLGKSSVYYASPEFLGFRRIVQLIRETPHDVLYLNSLFNVKFTTFPLLARKTGLLPEKPVVLAPRGEFSAGAVALKAWKKRPFIWGTRFSGLYRGITWQASSELEAWDIRQCMGDKARQIVVAPNLGPLVSCGSTVLSEVLSEQPGSCPFPQPRSGAAGLLKIVFLSRITPKKNLDYALRVLARVSIPVLFDIYGTIADPAYWAACRRLIEALPVHVTADYKGAVPHDAVHGILSGYDLFFLPTRGENYGHAIFEALAAGVPVLVSDKTPWQDLDEKGVGWVCSLDGPVDAFISAVEAQARMDSDARGARRARIIAYARSIVENKDVLERNRKLFENLVAGNQGLSNWAGMPMKRTKRLS